MKRLTALLGLMLVLLGLAFFAGCGRPGMAEDESDLPWAEPENWEAGPGIGFGG